MASFALQRWSDSLLRKPRRTAGDRNRRVQCKCGHKTTKNQLKLNGSVCHQCHEPLTLPNG